MFLVTLKNVVKFVSYEYKRVAAHFGLAGCNQKGKGGEWVLFMSFSWPKDRRGFWPPARL